MRYQRLAGSWPLLLLGGLLLACLPILSAQAVALHDEPPTEVTLENGYRVSFIGVAYTPEGTSTWRYRVEELASAQDLSNWVLALPECARIVQAWPEPWEAVSPDPNAQLSGIKWQTGAGFQSGEFSVTLAEPWIVGETQVAAKGPDLAYGSIAGPICTRQPELTLAKTVDRATAKAGDILTYAIMLENHGTTAVSITELGDPIPAGTTYVSDSLQVSGGVGHYDELTNQVHWEGDLAAKTGVSISFQVQIDDEVSHGSTITNVITLGDLRAQASTRLGPAAAPLPFQVYLPLLQRYP